MYKKEAIERLLAQILDGTESRLAVDSYTLTEKLEQGQVNITCSVHDARTGEKKVIEGQGVGIVDAFFHGLIALFSHDFPSLKTVRFVDFAIKANMETARASTRSDSNAEVRLTVANASGVEYPFNDASPSLTRAALSVVLHAAEFFINSERAFVAVYRALQHAREQNRIDSVELYTAQLATLVEATSYSEVILKIRGESPAST